MPPAQCSASAGSPRKGSAGVQCKAASVQERPAVSGRQLDQAEPLSLSDWDRLRLRRAAGESKIVPFRRRLRTPSGELQQVLGSWGRRWSKATSI